MQPGNTSFDSEELMAYEAGYRFMPGYDFSLDFTFFLNDYDKLQEYVKAEPGLNGSYIEQSIVSVNKAEGDVCGLEVSAAWQPAEWLKTNLAYSFLNTNVTGMEVPKQQVSLRTGLNPEKNLDVDIWLRYVDNTKTSYNTAAGFGLLEIDAYVTLDLRIAWRLTKNLELIAAGQNLLDEGHMEFVQEILIAPTEIPRSFYGQIKYLF